MADFNDNFINYSFERKTVSEGRNACYKDDAVCTKKRKALVWAIIMETLTLWI